MAFKLKTRTLKKVLKELKSRCKGDGIVIDHPMCIIAEDLFEARDLDKSQLKRFKKLVHNKLDIEPGLSMHDFLRVIQPGFQEWSDFQYNGTLVGEGCVNEEVNKARVRWLEQQVFERRLIEDRTPDFVEYE